VILLIAVALELVALPRLYEGIPLPFPRTAKPIGAALFSATFFHLLVISGAVLTFGVIMRRLGFKSLTIPRSKNDWLDLSMFLLLLISGLGMWFSSFFLIPFLIAGVYLVFVELK
jgi:hypothetical protein